MRTLTYCRIMFLILLIMGGVFPLKTAVAQGKRIVFFTPTSKNNTYWPQVFRILKAVSRDLNIDIDIHEFDVRDRFAKHVEGINILRKKPRPDGAIFSVAFGNAKPLLETAESLNIPVFIQGPVFPAELPDLGYTPRNKYAMWIGYFFQDECQKGYLLGKTLLKAAHDRKLYSDGKTVRVAGIGGDPSWFGSKLRENGLALAVSEDPKASLLQVVPTQWTETEGRDMTLRLLHRYPGLSVIWAASDQLGIGTAKAFIASEKTMGLNALTGGLDLSLNGLANVKNGHMTATVAATMIEYAEIVIYLFDYINGIDFADEVGTQISSTLHIASRDNAEKYIRLYETLESINYKELSKFLNPSLTRYDFSIDHMMAF